MTNMCSNKKDSGEDYQTKTKTNTMTKKNAMHNLTAMSPSQNTEAAKKFVRRRPRKPPRNTTRKPTSRVRREMGTTNHTSSNKGSAPNEPCETFLRRDVLSQETTQTSIFSITLSCYDNMNAKQIAP